MTGHIEDMFNGIAPMVCSQHLHAARARHRGKRPKSGYRGGRNRPKHQQQQATLRPGEEVIQCARAAVCSVNSSVLRCQATARAARYKCVMGTRGGLAVAVWGGHAPGVDQLPRKGVAFCHANCRRAKRLFVLSAGRKNAPCGCSPSRCAVRPRVARRGSCPTRAGQGGSG